MQIFKNKNTLISISVFCFLILTTGCIEPNAHALRIGAPPIEEGETLLTLRAMQSRRFDTLDTGKLIEASAATLQDLGFTINETSKQHGVLSGSKERDAVEAGQVTAQVILAVLAALGGSSHTMMYDETQKINVTLVVNKSGGKSSLIRVFFDRHISNNFGQLWKAEAIKEPEIYQAFFKKLSASTFLEANKI
ncbi:MAG: hypothetical protein RIB59_00970 [Rhodospirillales bacterium]